MPDYQCWPLWDVDEIGNIDPHTLPISQEAVARLERWAAAFEEDFNWDDPASSVWPEGKLDEFEAEGIRLWEQLRAELASQYDVGYFSQKLRRIVEDPRELSTDAPLQSVNPDPKK